MHDHIVLAVQIDWPGGLVQVTDTTLRIDAALFEDGQFEPRILGDVRWAESARHPYQQQAGELVVGNISLANADGGLDALATGDVVGAMVELRRGSDADRWADLEFVFRARVSGVRMRGRSELVLELENLLARLAGPVFDEKFDSSVPNPQLVGRDIPLVLGRVKQAPVLEFNPQQLTYYTAVNASKIGQVAEGGNPTQRWTLEEQPMFNLLGSPTLPITADFEGPGNEPWEVIIDDDLNTWVSGSDTGLTSPYTSQGVRPSGWALIVGDSGSTDISVAQDGGLKITNNSAGVTPATTFNVVSTSNGRSVQIGSSARKWTDAQKAIISDPGEAAITTNGTKSDELRVTTENFASASVSFGSAWDVIFGDNFSVVSGQIVVEYLAVYKNGKLKFKEVFNAPLNNTEMPGVLGSFWNNIKPQDLGNSVEIALKLRDDALGQFSVPDIFLFGRYAAAPSVHLRRDLGLVPGSLYSVVIEGNALEDVVLAWGAQNSAEEGWPDHSDYADFINQDSIARVSGSFAVGSVIKAKGSVFGLSYQPEFERGEAPNNGNVTITRVRITGQSAATTSYKTLAPYILQTAGIDPTAHLDQASINAHADAFGDPDLGWLVRGDESVDQVLFRLAGSLGGYVWHGLDGKVRSKRLELPTDPGVPTFVIDSSRADIDDITAYDDPAPQLTKRVHALRNWQPIDPDRQAGITSTWTEEDRAAAAADWRITRGYAADADFNRRWPAVASRDPYPSALLDAADAQNLADQAGLFAHKPRFYELPCELLIGELAQVAVGETVRVELDYPGLNGVYLLVLGREGGARPGTVHLTLWG